jgi:uncharacterized protein
MDGENTLAVGVRVADVSESGVTRLWAEMIGVYVGIPGLLIFFRHFLDGLVIPIIMTIAFTCWMVLKRQRGYDRNAFWNGRDFWSRFRRTLWIFLSLGAVVTYLSWLYAPHFFLIFPRDWFWNWLIVMAAYPLVSAYPQEVIYRTFFFNRYRRLFRNDWALVAASALLFGWAHMFLGNWIAPVFAFVGGILFGMTYLKTSSTLQSSLEHGLWGNLLFTLGTGWYFYAGSI